jgi:hypothetical protein
MSLAKFSEVLTKLGCIVEIEDTTLNIKIKAIEVSLKIDDVWLKSINHFFRAKQYSFNSAARILTSSSFIEFQVVKLDPNFFPRPEFEFVDDKGSQVKLTKASNEFLLSFYTSDTYVDFFEIVKRRLERRNQRLGERSQVRRDHLWTIRIDDLFSSASTVKFTPKPKLA